MDDMKVVNVLVIFPARASKLAIEAATESGSIWPTRSVFRWSTVFGNYAQNWGAADAIRTQP
jgi:hypothetical protein